MFYYHSDGNLVGIIVFVSSSRQLWFSFIGSWCICHNFFIISPLIYLFFFYSTYAIVFYILLGPSFMLFNSSLIFRRVFIPFFIILGRKKTKKHKVLLLLLHVELNACHWCNVKDTPASEFLFKTYPKIAYYRGNSRIN